MSTGFLVVGCAAPFAMRDAGVPVSPARVVGLPVHVESFTLDASREIRERSDWESSAQANLDISVNYRVSTHGGRFVGERDLKKVACYGEFDRWSKSALAGVLRHARGLRSSATGVYAWRFPVSLEAWRKVFDADFALISLFLDGEETGGRSALNVAGMFAGAGAAFARNDALACLIDLRDGRLVRCGYAERARAMAINMSTSVRDRGGAQLAVDVLATQLYSEQPLPPGAATPATASDPLPPPLAASICAPTSGNPRPSPSSGGAVPEGGPASAAPEPAAPTRQLPDPETP